MNTKRKVKEEARKPKARYHKFKELDGQHPFKESVPGAFVDYQVRQKPGGTVAFFNFNLAKEIGLIPQNHTTELTRELEQVILDTFSLVIINEYDEENNIKFDESTIKPNRYMATKYLQLQHESKKGKTSGDGRSVWNGCVGTNGTKWDISSCGTGATSLSPAVSKYGKHFQTGDPSISYGCGCSEVDEGLGSLFFSEIFNKNDIRTERVLAIIKYRKGLSINVRAHENLLRPSHFFNHLKQNNLESLKNVTDYYINRQAKNKAWPKVPKDEKEKYKFFLENVTTTFAHMAATFENEYIFCWLDWDGDNILMDGSIIDYGSIRQFGLFHHEYRYDDIDRYSTSIKEQKVKTRYLIQTFAQVADFVATGKKKNIKKFSRHWSLKKFDKLFEYYTHKTLLTKLGLNEKHADFFVTKYKSKTKNFKNIFSYFERAKSKKGLHNLPDGINWSAIFCMRDILRELPQLYLSRGKLISIDEFYEIIKSSYASKKDLAHHPYRNKKIMQFQNEYMNIVKTVSKEQKIPVDKLLLEMTMRSSVINKYDRVTGDSIGNIVDSIMAKRPPLNPKELFDVVNQFIDYQHFDPDKKKEKVKRTPKENKIIKSILKIVRDYREGV